MASSSKGLTKTHGMAIPTIHGLEFSRGSAKPSQETSASSESTQRYLAPKSPHTLIQEDLEGDPWKILVCCIMLNCTTRTQMESVMWEFFKRWPNPSSFLEADPTVVAELIRPLGFKNRRTERLRRFSQGFLELWESAASQRSRSQSSGESSVASSRPSSAQSSPCQPRAEASSTSHPRQKSQSTSILTISPTGQVVPSGEAIRQLYGIGEYAARAYEIFCLGLAGDEAPEDHALVKYWEWFREQASA